MVHPAAAQEALSWDARSASDEVEAAWPYLGQRQRSCQIPTRLTRGLSRFRYRGGLNASFFKPWRFIISWIDLTLTPACRAASPTLP